MDDLHSFFIQHKANSFIKVVVNMNCFNNSITVKKKVYIIISSKVVEQISLDTSFSMYSYTIIDFIKQFSIKIHPIRHVKQIIFLIDI